MSAGFFHTCALSTAGTIHCWGDDDDLFHRTDPPTAEAPFATVVSGRYHNCALTEDDRPVCTGIPRNFRNWGQQNPPPGAFIALTAGALFTCGLRPDRTLECWGNIDPDER